MVYAPCSSVGPQAGPQDSGDAPAPRAPDPPPEGDPGKTAAPPDSDPPEGDPYWGLPLASEQREPKRIPLDSKKAIRLWRELLRTVPARALERVDTFATAVRREFGLADDYVQDASTDRPAERGLALLRWLSAEVRIAVRETRAATRPEAAAVWRQKASELAVELNAVAVASRKGKARRELSADQRRKNEDAYNLKMINLAKTIQSAQAAKGEPALKRWPLAGRVREEQARGAAAGAKVLSQDRIDAILASEFGA